MEYNFEKKFYIDVSSVIILENDMYKAKAFGQSVFAMPSIIHIINMNNRISSYVNTIYVLQRFLAKKVIITIYLYKMYMYFPDFHLNKKCYFSAFFLGSMVCEL